MQTEKRREKTSLRHSCLLADHVDHLQHNFSRYHPGHGLGFSGRLERYLGEQGEGLLLVQFRLVWRYPSTSFTLGHIITLILTPKLTPNRLLNHGPTSLLSSGPGGHHTTCRLAHALIGFGVVDVALLRAGENVLQ